MAKTPFRSPVPGNVGAGPKGGDPDFRAKTEFLRRWWKEPQAYPDEFKSWLINFIEHHPDLLLEESAIPRIHWSKIIDPQTGVTPDEWIIGTGPPAPSAGKVGDLYLDTSTGTIYEKTGTSTWTLKGVITGAPGPPGPTGPAGTVYDTDQIGTVKSWTGKTIPTNWRLCNGQTISEALAPDLAVFAAAEVAAGNPLWGISGTAPNRTITLPDLRNKFIYGVAQTDLADMGAAGGVATVTLDGTHMPPHGHVVTSHSHGGGTGGQSQTHTHLVHSERSVSGLTVGSLYDTQIQVIPGAGIAYTHVSDPPSVDHSHAITPESPGTNTAYGSGGVALAHENLPPYIRLAHIVKVAGPMIDPGGALIGQTGPQGIQGPPGGASYVQIVGDGVSTSFVVTHGSGTRDVHVTVRRNSSPYDDVVADVEHTDGNTVTVRVLSPPATNGLVVMVSRGSGDSNYVHSQVALAAVWNVAHGLGKFPSIEVVDTGNSVLWPDVHYVDANNVQLTFAAPTSGKVYVN